MNGAGLNASLARAATAAQLVVIVWLAVFGNCSAVNRRAGQQRILMKSPIPYRNFFVRFDTTRDATRHIRPIARGYQQKMLKDLWKNCRKRVQLTDAAAISLAGAFRGSTRRFMRENSVAPPRFPGVASRTP
ncbi:MAG: hypothetical protein ACTHKH_07515 [Trinickia sp.]